MSAKQDCVAPRTANDIEQRYNFRRSFAEVMGVATDARSSAADAKKSADEAKKAAENVDAKLTAEELFNLLTNGGTMQGIYRGDDGEIYINASYIKSGEFLADLIKAGVIKSKDGNVWIDLDKGVGTLACGVSAHLSTWDEEMLGWTKDINEVLAEFVSVELEKMQFDTIKEFAARLDSNAKYPEGAKISLFKFRKMSAQPFASITFEWADGTVSHMTASKGGELQPWEFSEMEWR